MRHLKVIAKSSVYGFLYGGVIGGLIFVALPSISKYWPFEWSEVSNKSEEILPLIVVCIFHLLEGVLWGICIGLPVGVILGCILAIIAYKKENTIVKQKEEL